MATKEKHTDLTSDYILPFTVDRLGIRGRYITLDSVIDQILTRHDYPEAVAHLLAKMLSATALIGSALKFEGKLSLQAAGSGPVNLLVCDFMTPSNLRGYARFDEILLNEAIAQKKIHFKDLVGEGHLAFTIQQKEASSFYQGFVAIEDETLDRVVEKYFLQSEQIAAKLTLSSAKIISGAHNKYRYHAGGIFIQQMPNSNLIAQTPQTKIEQADAFAEATLLLNTIDAAEFIEPQMTGERMLYRLFHEYDPRIFDKIPLFEKCTCSRERLENLLKGFSKKELENSVEDGKISAACQFCSKTYDFDPKDF